MSSGAVFALSSLAAVFGAALAWAYHHFGSPRLSLPVDLGLKIAMAGGGLLSLMYFDQHPTESQNCIGGFADLVLPAGTARALAAIGALALVGAAIDAAVKLRTNGRYARFGAVALCFGLTLILFAVAGYSLSDPWETHCLGIILPSHQ